MLIMIALYPDWIEIHSSLCRNPLIYQATPNKQVNTTRKCHSRKQIHGTVKKRNRIQTVTTQIE